MDVLGKRARRRNRAIAPLAVAAALAVGLLSGPASAAFAATSVTGTGSSFAYPAFSVWETTEGIVNEADTNSIVGLNSFAQGTVDYGASDISYDTGQAQYTPRPPFQYLPDVSGGLAFDFNLTGVNGQQITNLRLSPSTLVGIFTDHITTWNNAAIIRDNLGNGNVAQNLPSTPIKVIVRGDACGETYLLEYYFQTVEPQAWDAYVAQVTPGGHPGAGQYVNALYDYPSNTGVPYPPNLPFTGWLNPNGAPSDIAAVSGADGTIGYSVTAWPIEDSIPYAFVQNPAGAWVQPDVHTIATALSKAILYSDLTENLVPVFTNANPASYPISSYSYMITQEGQINPAIGARLSAFIYYMACAGQAQVERLEYSPIPENLVIDDFEAAERLAGHSAAPALNASGCPNPYFVGSLPPVPEPVITNISAPGGGSVPGEGSATTPGASNSGQAGSSANNSPGPAAGSAPAAAGSSAGSNSVSSTNSAGAASSHSSAKSAGHTSSGATTTSTTISASKLLASLPGGALRDASAQLPPAAPSALTTTAWAVGLVVLLLIPPACYVFVRRRRRTRSA
jgi:ABC-type phosphate transport system substrate-binding protein